MTREQSRRRRDRFHDYVTERVSCRDSGMPERYLSSAIPHEIFYSTTKVLTARPRQLLRVCFWRFVQVVHNGGVWHGCGFDHSEAQPPFLNDVS